jgi:hypothetical protein
MLLRAKELSGYKLGARDGWIGTVKEFYFDDKSWTIRYLVANTGNWLTGRRVLLSPFALDPVRKDDGMIPVDLTMKQIEHSPSLDSDKPVSRQFELQYYPYYGWPAYWDGSYAWGTAAFPRHGHGGWSSAIHHAKTDNPHLRSTEDVDGHTVQALDGGVGHVADFVIDDETWAIRYLIVDLHNWLPAKKVLISPKWIDNISWEDSQVVVGLTCDAIKESPEYTEDALITRDYETQLHRHYKREGYWAGELIHSLDKH